MAEKVSGDTLVDEVLGEEIAYNGAVWRIERLSPEEHMKQKDRGDVDGYGYKLVAMGDDVPVGAEEQIVSNNLIGCPECLQNQYADFTGDGRYECPCGYSNELNIATLLSP